jgi:hypothetical protein
VRRAAARTERWQGARGRAEAREARAAVAGHAGVAWLVRRQRLGARAAPERARRAGGTAACERVRWTNGAGASERVARRRRCGVCGSGGLSERKRRHDAVLVVHAGAQALEQARDRQTRVSRQRRAERARARQVRDPGGSEQPGASSGVGSGPGARVEQRVRGGAARARWSSACAVEQQRGKAR